MSQKSIGRYHILRELGRGGMATVYLAFDPVLEREVALKVLPTYFAHEAEFSARFEQEAKTIAALEHRCIVSMYDYGEDGDWPYIVMRYMSGGNLKERLAQGALSVAEAGHILQRVGSALDKAHSRGIVHRDVKPGNILFDEDGEAFLCDFGIVKLAASSATYTQTGNILGTPAYMSPEQARAVEKLDGRSDIYSLGVVLYEMLTGNIPYKADTTLGQAMMHVLEPVPDILVANADLPPACQDIIFKAMAKQKADRYSTAAALATAVQAVAAGAIAPPAPEKVEEAVVEETAVSPPQTPPPAAKPTKQAPSKQETRQAEPHAPTRRDLDRSPPVVQTSQATVMPKPTFAETPPPSKSTPIPTPAKEVAKSPSANPLQRWWRAGLLLLAVLLAIYTRGPSPIIWINVVLTAIVGIEQWINQRRGRGAALLFISLLWFIAVTGLMNSVPYPDLTLIPFTNSLTLLACFAAFFDPTQPGGVPLASSQKGLLQQWWRVGILLLAIAAPSLVSDLVLRIRLNVLLIAPFGLLSMEGFAKKRQGYGWVLLIAYFLYDLSTISLITCNFTGTFCFYGGPFYYAPLAFALLSLVWTSLDAGRGISGGKAVPLPASQARQAGKTADWRTNWFVFLFLLVLAVALGFGAALLWVNQVCMHCSSSLRDGGGYAIWAGGAIVVYWVGLNATKNWRQSRIHGR